jgi:cephalosporin-C deacetylase-like acetyl esterase
VVQSCGHYKEGKADPDYQTACIGLALKGFVALIFDPMGQGERWMFYGRGQEPSSATAEHSLAGVPTLLVGRTLANYRMWDVMRALDYMETRADVDPARMGMLGHSGGGMMTLLTSPLEPRIRAAMSCCAVTTFYHKTRALLMADPEQIVPGIYAGGVDHPEMIATVAPRAFLIGAVLRDFVPLDGTRRTFDETRRIYEILGVPENFGKVESDNVHKLDQNLREACYGWMLKHLAGETGDTHEPEITVESDRNLWCTPTGRVMELEHARSVFDLNRAEAQRLAAGRPAADLDIRPLLAVAADPQPEPGIDVPTTLAEGSQARDALLIVISDQGRDSAAAKELAGAFTAAGYSVLGVDLRGWGETTCTKAKQENFSWDEFVAWRAIEMGRPLLGMRVRDLLAAARPMAPRYRKIYVVGIRAAGLVALHAAALDHSIAGVATYQTLDSYQDVIDHLRHAEPVSSLVFGALTRYDLPELAQRIGPRPAIAVDPFDASRHPVGATSVGAAEAARRILEGLHLS